MVQEMATTLYDTRLLEGGRLDAGTIRPDVLGGPTNS
jgi:hypothetical protein